MTGILIRKGKFGPRERRHTQTHRGEGHGKMGVNTGIPRVASNARGQEGQGSGSPEVFSGSRA